jgi:hypothetical protein
MPALKALMLYKTKIYHSFFFFKIIHLPKQLKVFINSTKIIPAPVA